MIFEDRVSAYPGRYIMTDEGGGVSHVVLERDDEPVRPGTPLNAETFNAMFASIYPGMQSEEHPGCYYRIVDGETEWITPPLILDVEYRTTERFNGLPVYVKRITFANAGLGSDGASKEIFKHGCTVVSYSAILRTKDGYQTMLPTFNSNGTVSAHALIHTLLGEMDPEMYPNDFAWIQTPGISLTDYSDYEITVKYTKA